MTRLLGGCVLGVLVLGSLPASGEDKCICPQMNAASVAWCGHCGSGVAFGHPVKSQKLITVLQGAPVQPDQLKCPGCKQAAQAGGAHCNKIFARGKAYDSFVAGAIAKGEVIEATQIECAQCKKAAAERGAFFCTGCNRGFVDGLAFNSKEDFEAAKKADVILVRAVATTEKCEQCAVGMVTNGQCTHCKVTFKDGEPIKS